MVEKVMRVLEIVLNQNLSELTHDKIVPDNIHNWDSLTHLSLITALEDEFDIDISIDDISEMNGGFNNIIDILKRYGVN